MEIEVLSLGTKVTIDNDIPAVIRGITIYNEHWVKYQCVWWDERVRKEEWLETSEIKMKVASPKSTVRFK